MTRNEAFAAVVDEFAKDMELNTCSRTQFNAREKNGAYYTVWVNFKERDSLTDEPRYVKVVVVTEPHKVHDGQWVAIDNADRAAQVALATIRNTEYVVQGELL